MNWPLPALLALGAFLLLLTMTVFPFVIRGLEALL